MVAPAWALPKGRQLGIGLLHTGDVSMDWAMMLSQLQRPAGTAFVSSSHWPGDVGRNWIVENAMRENAEYVLMLDSDVVPPRDAILRLMAHKVPIVHGLYYMRTPPFVPFVMRLDPTTKPGEGVREGSLRGIYENAVSVPDGVSSSGEKLDGRFSTHRGRHTGWSADPLLITNAGGRTTRP